jgi:protein-L-isoaspartate(D-aspartate) O-methyltransferase
MAVLSLNGCRETEEEMMPRSQDADRRAERDRMVDEQIIRGGTRDPRVIAAMRVVPRHRFVPDRYSTEAYDDGAVPIGYGQTISQPAVVAAMTEALQLTGKERILEIGTGSGYQSAILAELVPLVYSIEIVEPLARQAAAVLHDLGRDNVMIRVGDGYNGWPEEAPFDAIIVTAAPDHVPKPLLDQLAVGGRMVVPIGKDTQQLMLYRRTPAGFEQRTLDFVRFVPLIHDEPPRPAAGPDRPEEKGNHATH